MTVTVLRGTSIKVKLELPTCASLAALSTEIERNVALGRIPCKRQRLLVGYPPTPLEERHPGCSSMSIAELGVKAVKQEDIWEELVADLRAGKGSFERLAMLLTRKAIPVQENHDFLLSSAKDMLKDRAKVIEFGEMKA